MPLQATSGAASYDAFGGGVPVVPAYIEEVFSTYLYTGNGASGQSIVNGINLSTKGGLVWLKSRTTPSGSSSNNLYDTVRGASQLLISNSTDAQTTATRLSFQTTGFNLTNEASSTNESGVSYVSWTFREQPKFFDVVTFTSSSAGDTTFSHNLGAVPGCIILKNTQSTDGWVVYHRSVGNNAFLRLNTTAAQDPLTGSFSVTSTSVTVNASLLIDNNTYVAYLFAHNAGGFGLTGTDNVISCGSMAVGGGVDAVVNLGYEPQWVMFKQAQVGGSGNWRIADNMRGVSTGNTSGDLILSANLTAAEADAGANLIDFTSTGFIVKDNVIQGGDPYIYIAIRRGPMKVPTSGTSVFDVDTYTGDDATSRLISSGFATDTALITDRTDASYGQRFISDRLRGGGNSMATQSTAAENGDTGYYNSDMLDEFRSNSGILVTPKFSRYNASGKSNIAYQFKRAPSFHDVVCYTGTGSARTINHNLGVAPEMMIAKIRSGADSWIVYHSALGATKYVLLDGSGVAQTDSTMWNNTAPTASVFSLGSSPGTATNLSGSTYVAYLFATATGVSKVGSYTGTGTTQQINCGFTSGARFVLIKRTSTGGGDWYVWDSARGIVSGNDPYLLLNSTAAEVTNTDYIDTYSAGFEISSTAPAAINASGGTFIFLAIA